MAPSGWAIMVDYYQNKDTKTYIPYAVPVVQTAPAIAVAATTASTAEETWAVKDTGVYGTTNYSVVFSDAAGKVALSPWHDITLQLGSVKEGGMKDPAPLYHMVVEIPHGSLVRTLLFPPVPLPTLPAGFSSSSSSFLLLLLLLLHGNMSVGCCEQAKLEVQKKVAHNPIMQDSKKGKARFYTYGVPNFNYGMLPQTWDDPAYNTTVEVLDSEGQPSSTVAAVRCPTPNFLSSCPAPLACSCTMAFSVTLPVEPTCENNETLKL